MFFLINTWLLFHSLLILFRKYELMKNPNLSFNCLIERLEKVDSLYVPNQKD